MQSITHQEIGSTNHLQKKIAIHIHGNEIGIPRRGPDDVSNILRWEGRFDGSHGFDRRVMYQELSNFAEDAGGESIGDGDDDDVVVNGADGGGWVVGVVGGCVVFVGVGFGAVVVVVVVAIVVVTSMFAIVDVAIIVVIVIVIVIVVATRDSTLLYNTIF